VIAVAYTNLPSFRCLLVAVIEKSRDVNFSLTGKVAAVTLQLPYAVTYCLATGIATKCLQLPLSAVGKKVNCYPTNLLRKEPPGPIV
jgi:hypothetical protein